MPEEEKTTVEEKTVEEERVEVEETEVEETKTEPVKEAPDAKEETKLGDGDGTKTSVEPPTYDEVIDFIERHDLPKGLALGESMTIVMDEFYLGSKDCTMRLIVFGMGQTTDADFGEDGPASWGDELTRALYVGDVATGVVYTQYFGDYPEKSVVSLPHWLDHYCNLPNTDCFTYFGFMACLYILEKEALGGGGKKAKAAGDEDSDGYFEVSEVGCATPYRDRSNMHVSIAVEYPPGDSGGSGGMI